MRITNKNYTVMKELSAVQIKALEKLNKELKKDVEVATEMAKQGYLFDLLYFVYSLKSMRIHSVQANDTNQESAFFINTVNLIEESIKYSIQLLAKYASADIVLDKETEIPIVNFKLTQALSKQCTMINSKYESQSMIQLFNVEILDDEVKQLKISMDNIKDDDDAKKFFDYFLRIDRDNDNKKKDNQTKSVLIDNFKKEYTPINNLFKEAYGISVDEFCDMINWLLDRSVSLIEKAKENFEYLENGNIKDQSMQTMSACIPSLIIKVEEMNKQFPEKYSKVIDALTFNKEIFNEFQLRYHLITRSPLIKIKDHFIISPELLLDSLFTNTHYSLLESTVVGETYKAMQADLFIDKLVNISSQYGFTEVDRELDLYERKNQIGDLDLILKDKNNKYLLIEAKNHALTMDVYFKDVEKTREHLSDLKNNWEKKVIKRVEHLKLNHGDYDIPETYQYIIVSRYPEIISHYTGLLALSVAEFEYWLQKNRYSEDFEEITNDFYAIHERKFSKDELNELSKIGLIIGKFSEK